VAKDRALRPLHGREDFAQVLESMKKKHEAFAARVAASASLKGLSGQG
jgi:hypothetical protein